MASNKIVFQFLAEPNDVNFGGKVHGGAVMKWIDQASYACASHWCSSYCVTVYVGGIRFYDPILIGDLVRVESEIIYTGRTSMHVAVDVRSREVKSGKFRKTTHCIIVFVSVDKEGKTQPVPEWIPKTDEEIAMRDYAIKLVNLRKNIETEMDPFLKK
jgi:acyl-CoA hydrolase